MAAVLAVLSMLTKSVVCFTLSCVYSFFLLWRKRALFFACMCCYLFFSLWSRWVAVHHVTTLSGNETTFFVRFIAPIYIDGDRVKTTVQWQKERLQLVYRLRTEEEKRKWEEIQIGTACLLKGTLERPSLPTNPYAFNYRRYLFYERIHWIVRPNSLESCTRTNVTWIERLQIIRQQGIRYIQHHFPNDVSAFMQALIYGERSDIEPTVLASYQKLGLIHLLAISGLHMTLLVGGCFYLFIRFGISRERATVILLGCIPLYAVLAGAAPSVMRAAIMTSCFLLFSSRFRTIDALSIACLLLLGKDPYTVFHLGFQLSFLVCFALIICSSFIQNERSIVRQLFMTSFIAQISTLPLLLYHFYEVSLLSIPLNIIFVPLYSFIILPLCFVALLSHLFMPFVSSLIIYVLTVVLEHTNALVLSLSDMFVLTLGRPPLLLLVAYIVSVFLFFLSFESKKRAVMFRFSFLFVMIAHVIWPFFRPTGEVVMLEVGQGDSIYIELPYRKAVYMIDTGGTMSFTDEHWKKRKQSFRVGEDVIVPFLKAKGVRTLDALIATHGDFDHIGDTNDIFDAVRVRKLIVGMQRNDLIESVMEQAVNKGTRVQIVKSGDRWTVGKAQFYILSPFGNEETTNDGSIVLYALMGGAYWLFTGDLEEKGEQQIMRTYPSLPVDILKVGHHGSKTSTSESFLRHIRPKLALISVGRGNRYGHPHREVIERLRHDHVRIFRTDEHGAVVIRFHKRISTIQTFLP
ncbi:DNA internalization-related competence protein ComEC/Rec2 [Anoxybacillus kestanbolensis]|uniref:DNA internalization-related competence protein ComEC/Rec2 n=1 Tax=Anoxybacillus kestanbolensis TaxID=227476 RepID=A0A1V3FTQ8_9BACL|nr:DNA internalization-related competence protein ComEC/Rec2 [Anoxybacillus kestanbolensis]OOE05102.1 DNA internalization-related competence protein ComEC/Rec2 [Anoxybacillus kestanbolensis]